MTKSAHAMLGIIGAAWMVALPFDAVSQDFPRTRSEFYEVGERFAHCSAYFAHAASAAERAGLSESANAFSGMERGWALAGTLLLTEGVDETRQTDVQVLFGTLQHNKLDQIRAQQELGQSADESAQAYQRECGPWTDMQKSIIQAMRAGPTD